MIPYGKHYLDEDDIAAVAEVLRSGWITQGPKIPELESVVANFVGSKYAVAVSSGTTALHLAYLAAGLGAESKVVTSNNTFVASANCKVAWQARGSIHYGAVESENSSLARRSLYIVQDMRAGDILTKENLRSIRPGYGLPVKYLNDLLGMSVTRAVERGTRMSWDLVK